MSGSERIETAFPQGDLPEERLPGFGHRWVDDLKCALQEARWMGLISSLILGFLMFHLLISYPIAPPRILAPAPLIRPLLTAHETMLVRNDVQNGHTTFQIDGTSYSLRHFKSVAADGNFHPPDIFYQGVFFGISQNSSHRFEYLNNENISSLGRNISSELNSLRPVPTSIHQRLSHHDSGFSENGYGLYYSFDDLKSVGLHSSDVKQPWKRILSKIIELGVRLDIPYVLFWHPNSYGKNDDERYEHILQTIVPTRTGYSSLRSSRAVWLSAINHTTLKRDSLVFRKEWTRDDHWTQYPLEAPAEL